MRRRNFGESNPIDSEDWSNLTKYDEKYILPTDGTANVAQDPVPVPQSMASVPAQGYGQQEQSSAATVATEQPVYSVGRGYTQAPSEIATERPMVFALRAYKDVYVYEYSDRLEYYKHTETGMIKCNSEYKKR